MQFAEHRTLGEDSPACIEFGGVVTAQPVAHFVATFQKAVSTGFAERQLILDRVERWESIANLAAGAVIGSARFIRGCSFI